jgi:hypothetical protein
MLKISVTRENGTVTLRAEGRAVSAWVMELRACCETALAAGYALKLDLLEVEYADAGALKLIADLKMRGAVLVKCSPFLAEQLRAISPSKDV